MTPTLSLFIGIALGVIFMLIVYVNEKDRTSTLKNKIKRSTEMIDSLRALNRELVDLRLEESATRKKAEDSLAVLAGINKNIYLKIKSINTEYENLHKLLSDIDTDLQYDSILTHLYPSPGIRRNFSTRLEAQYDSSRFIEGRTNSKRE